MIWLAIFWEQRKEIAVSLAFCLGESPMGRKQDAYDCFQSHNKSWAYFCFLFWVGDMTRYYLIITVIPGIFHYED